MNIKTALSDSSLFMIVINYSAFFSSGFSTTSCNS